MWLQNVESCGQNSSKITVTLLYFFKNCSHFSKFTIIFANFAVTFRILQSYFESCSHVTADFEKLISKCDCKMLKVAVTFRIMTAIFNICGHISKSAITWLQLSTFCSHISNYDCNFQHFAVTVRIMTATFNILQSHFELWPQSVEICSHIWDFWNCQHCIWSRLYAHSYNTRVCPVSDQKTHCFQSYNQGYRKTGNK